MYGICVDQELDGKLGHLLATKITRLGLDLDLDSAVVTTAGQAGLSR